MGNNINVTISVDNEMIGGMLSALLDDGVRTQLQEEFAKIIDPWTPFLSGALHSDITIDSTGVTYNVPYAADKYYGTVYHKEVHPLATSHWDEVALQSEMESLTERIKAVLAQKAKELYG